MTSPGSVRTATGGHVLAGPGLPGAVDPGGLAGRPGRADRGTGLHHHGLLDYALLEKSLGLARTMAWFPVIPGQHPDPVGFPARISTWP